MPSADVTITITAPNIQEAVRLVSDHGGYQETIDGSPNPQTRGAYVKQMVARLLKQWARDQREIEAKAAAAQNLPDDITVE